MKDETLSLERARKCYFLKFRHIELAIGRDFHSKILEGYT